MKRFIPSALCVLALVLAVVVTAQAEVKRKRYTFDVDARKRQASLLKAKTKAQQEFLREYLASKFAPDIVNRYAEDIDIALDPPEKYLTRFDVVSERMSDDNSQVTLTVEGEVDTAAMIAALVQFDVLSFGDEPPKVMLIPSSRFNNDVPIEPIRAMIYENLKQAGLRSVDYRQNTETLSIQVRPGGQLTPGDKKVLIRKAIDYNTDYLVYVDIDPGIQPFSRGGYLADTDVMYTILRPNANAILGESMISARGNGSSQKLAYRSALDELAPEFATVMLGQLYESIYADSDVITDTVQLETQIDLAIHEGKPEQIQAILNRLKDMGARVDLGTGSGLVNRYNVEIKMDDTQIYEMFNALRLSAGGREFKTPVVAYAENVVEVEVIPINTAPRRQVAAKPKPRRGGGLAKAGDGRFGGGRGGNSQAGTTLGAKAKVTLKLRPAKFSL